MTFEAHYRYRENGELNDHFVDIVAASAAEAKRIAKGQEGRNPTMWLYKIRPKVTSESRMLKSFTAFLTEGGTLDFEGTIGELKKQLRPGEYIKWNARGPQSDSTKCTVVMKDYDDYDYFSVESEDGMTDFGSIEQKKK